MQCCCIGIFLQQNAPNPCYWTPNSCFGAFWIVPILDELRCKRGRTSETAAQVRATNWCWNFSKRTHAIQANGPQTHVLGCFGPLHYYTNFGANQAELGSLMHKFMQQCRVGFFRNERTRYTPMDPRLMFWSVSDHSIITRTSVQNGLNWCHQCTNSSNYVASESFTMNAPDTAHGTPDSYFWGVSDCSITAKTSVQIGLNRGH
jgi:hypothetical protein